MSKIVKSFIRMMAFLSKEISEVIRQPRLLLTLVLGPFLILFVFGIGYQNKARALRTRFVVQKDSPIKGQIEQYAKTLGPQLIYAGVTSDEAEALEDLRQGRIDLVAVAPTNAYETIRNSKQAVFILYNHEIDPTQISYVKYFGQVYIDEVNRRVLLAITEQGQKEATSLQSELSAAHQNAVALHNAIQAGDMISARQHQSELASNLDNITLAVGASLGVLNSVQQTLGGGSTDAGAILAALSDIRKNTNALNNVNSSSYSKSQDLQNSAKIEKDLAKLQDQLKEFTSIDPNVIVRPFRSEAKSIAKLQPTALDFFAPAVIALLLQHLAITFAALSIVRERSVGTMELFRVSPLTSSETLLGKYLSYMLFGVLLTVALTLLVVYVLHVPMLGSWFYYSLVILALLFSSLGFGFFISLISKTDSQAVQLTMIMLLASVFFSGFMMSLDMIKYPVSIVSWSLPTTYSIIMLRDIVLRGIVPDMNLLAGLTLIGVGLCLISWFMLRRVISTS